MHASHVPVTTLLLKTTYIRMTGKLKPGLHYREPLALKRADHCI